MIYLHKRKEPIGTWVTSGEDEHVPEAHWILGDVCGYCHGCVCAMESTGWTADEMYDFVTISEFNQAPSRVAVTDGPQIARHVLNICEHSLASVYEIGLEDLLGVNVKKNNSVKV